MTTPRVKLNQTEQRVPSLSSAHFQMLKAFGVFHEAVFPEEEESHVMLSFTLLSVIKATFLNGKLQMDDYLQENQDPPGDAKDAR